MRPFAVDYNNIVGIARFRGGKIFFFLGTLITGSNLSARFKGLTAIASFYACLGT